MRLVYPKINLEKIEKKNQQENKKLKTLLIEITWYTLLPAMITYLSNELNNPLILLTIIPMIILRVIE